MVLELLNEHNDTYIAANHSPLIPTWVRYFNNERKKLIFNNFRMVFQQIEEQTGTQVRIDNFESSIIEVRRIESSSFLERLTLCEL